MPVADVLESAASRVDSIGSDPLILASGGTLTGIVTLGDLLSAAATVVTEISSRISPVTGLPSRAKADEHMTALIRLAEHGGHAAFDAAMIDLRRFSEFNRRMGFELGDDLLRRVGGMIKRAVVPDGEAGSVIFVGHLGDDRFIVTGPAGQLRARLETLVADFVRTERGADFAGQDGGKVGSPALRVLLLPSVFSRVATVGDVHRMAERFRATDRTESAEIQVVAEPVRRSA